MSKNINDYSLDELRKREYEDTDIHDYTRNEYSYGCTIISYSRHVKTSMFVINGIFTLGIALPFWINHDNNLRKKRETHYFYTETGEELGSSKEEAIYEADKIGEEKMKQKMYAEASSYFNVAYHLCDDSREEGYKQKRDEANEEIQKENDEKERREREARAREEAREREKRQREIREQQKRERELERERKQLEIREKQEKEEARERERRQREIREKQEKEETREREVRQREIREKQEKEEARERERRQREIREKQEKEEARERERRQRDIREQEESEEARQREIREREAKGESRERKEKQREANEIYQEAHKMWNEAFLLENYNSEFTRKQITENYTEANKKFEESNKLFLKASTLNPHELIYSNWFSISSLKLEGDCLFNEALSLQEQGNRLRQKQKYEQALVKYEEAQMKYTEGYNRSMDTRFKACIKFVDSWIIKTIFDSATY